ncbi:MAG: peptide-methionine (S)-S-oxide reductase [Gemmatimonadetes bacterium]|nr:peptide-methionine (S)-S-oxide reductase [Gemmatimonadota bacterium]
MTRNAIAALSALLFFPAPAHTQAKTETAVFAGGCFWGIEAVFEHTKGVLAAVSGYTGGDLKNPTYGDVTTETTGHAESVRVTFDPSVITYDQLLEVFFAVHDPTQLNRQGPDVGTSYRSAVFYANTQQRMAAYRYVAKLNADKQYKKNIVTTMESLGEFYEAEGYHQNYLALHPNEPYIVYNDLPKLAFLKHAFPALWRDATTE